MNKSMRMLALLLVPALAVASAKEPGTPGTLTNEKLRSDTLGALLPQVSAAGCGQAQDLRTYVVAQPEGEVGARVWRERWVVSCDTGEFPADIRFNEAGMDAADYHIRLVR